MLFVLCIFFFSSIRRHTRCALVTGVQTCALPIYPVSLYLVVPPSDSSRTKPLIRLLLNQIGRRLTESLDGSDGIVRRHKLLLMLDEFPALGRLDFFESTLAFMAGYEIGRASCRERGCQYL